MNTAFFASSIRRLKDFFGNWKISFITAGDIEGYRIERKQEPGARDKESPIALSTIDREVTMIRALLHLTISEYLRSMAIPTPDV